MKTAEIRQLTSKEIQERIEDERATLVRFKVNHAVSPLDNPTKIKKSRRLVARLITELHQRTLNKK